VDPRVVAIAPAVIDVLNLEASFSHHYRAYGFWAPAIRDYEEEGIMNWFGTPQIRALAEIEDPYEYRERLTLPKYVINATGDQFFLPDSSQFSFSDLPGEKYLRYVPNTDHNVLETPETVMNLLSWFQAVTQNFPRPRFYWKTDRDNGRLLIRTVDKPSRVTMWQASNPGARDFRVETIGRAWTAGGLEGENGIYFVEMPKPVQGWTAFFVELAFPGPGDLPLVFTTEVVVTPNSYPEGR
jgi:PhoPQ-activated pathogenicity-related protein